MGTTRFRHGAPVVHLEFSNDGKLLASLGADDTIRLWEPSSGKELSAIRPAEKIDAPFAISPNGKYLATVGKERVQIWDTGTGRELHSIDDPNLKNKDFQPDVVFSPDGKTLLGTSGPEELRLIDVESGKETRRLSRMPNFSTNAFYRDHHQLSFAPDGHTVATLALQGEKVVVEFLPITEDGKGR
jgi:hypothetical protein